MPRAMPDATIAELSERFGQDREAIFGWINQEVVPSLIRYMVRRTGDDHLAEDMLQEALLELTRTIAHLRPNSSVRTLLRHFALTEWIDTYRGNNSYKRGKGFVRRATLENIAAMNCSTIGDTEFEAFVLNLLRALPKELRPISFLWLNEGRSTEEIADMFGVSQRTVQRKLREIAGELLKNRDIRMLAGLPR